MTLLTAHRILIGAAVVFFAFYGGWEFMGGSVRGGSGSVVRGWAAVAAAAAFAIYFLTLLRRDDGDDDTGGAR